MQSKAYLIEILFVTTLHPPPPLPPHGAPPPFPYHDSFWTSPHKKINTRCQNGQNCQVPREEKREKKRSRKEKKTEVADFFRLQLKGNRFLGPRMIDEGRHAFPFSFKIPNREMPSSPHWVDYKLKAKLKQTMKQEKDLDIDFTFFPKETMEVPSLMVTFFCFIFLHLHSGLHPPTLIEIIETTSKIVEQENMELKHFCNKDYKNQDLENDIDPDTNFFSHISNNCFYYTDDQYNSNITCDNKLSIVHFNSRSLYANYNNIKNFLEHINEPFKVIAVTETWIDDKKGIDFDLEGYELNYINRTNKNGGGVAVYVMKNLNYKVVKNM
ncbi:uncharacterized protein LOC133652321 isoform X1 [Entelurus aequoreus]|uniref:uncharacterized protein LOC133652321 isoform X1 n=1 Tax=Entelurus aequoreus TaxID=161455 RepID=UPI002B1E628B|nr:uncharacterized protein LOC133652321 isoform X1 [Entelurus aequoreus]